MPRGEVWHVPRAGAGFVKFNKGEKFAGPDLTVTGLSWSVEEPVVGTPLRFSAQVKNLGATITAGTIIGVAFSVNNTVVNWSDNHTSGLASGDTITLTANGGPGASSAWTPTSSGSFTITATVDDVNRFPNELNESNNSLTRTMTVGAGTSTDLTGDFSSYSATPTVRSSGHIEPYYFAQTFEGGSTFDTNMRMIPTKAQGAHIAANGVLVTSANWDENGGELYYNPGDGSAGFIYQDVHHPGMGPAVTIDPSNGKVWASNPERNGTGVRRFPTHRHPGEAQINTGVVVWGMAIIGSELFLACQDNRIRVYNTSSLAFIREWAVPQIRKNSLIAVNGRLALILGATPPGPGSVVFYNTTGGELGRIENLADPRGLGVDHRAGTERLVVCLGTNDHRLAVYDTVSRALVDYFGVQGGMYSNVGAPRGNAVDKRRLLFPRAARIFADGSVSVVLNLSSHRDEEDSGGSGLILRKFSSMTGTSAPVWDLYGLAFCDGGYIDPTNPVDAFTVHDRFKVDQATGKWFHYARTMDLDNNPNDPRPAVNDNHGYVNCYIVHVSGQRYMITVGMFGEPFRVFKPVEDTYVDTGQELQGGSWRGMHITPNNVIWFADSGGVRRRAITGINGDGTLALGAETRWAAPGEWDGVYGDGGDGTLKRAYMDEATGTLYVTGWHSGYPQGNTDPAPGYDMQKIAGNGMAAYANFESAGFSQRIWMRALPAEHLGYGNRLRSLRYIASICLAGDYIIVAEAAAQNMHMYRKSNGEKVKGYIPGSMPAVDWTSQAQHESQYSTNRYKNGYSDYQQPGIGFLDCTIGLHAYRASNGVIVITMYENGAQKVCWMQWTP